MSEQTEVLAAEKTAILEAENARLRERLSLAEIDIADLKAISRSRYDELQRLRALLAERAD